MTYEVFPSRRSTSIDLAATHLRHGAEAYRSEGPAAMHGSIATTSLRDGLTVVSARFRLEAHLSSEVLLPPGLSLSMVLDGRSVLGEDERQGPGSFAFDLSPTSRWRRIRASSGQGFRFVSISAPIVRLDALGLGGDVVRYPRSHRGQMPDRLVALAAQLARSGQDSPANRLLQEAAGLEIIGRLLDDGAETGPRSMGPLSPRERRAMDEVQAIIASELDGDLTLATLARRVGLGLSQLKVLFRSRFGTTVGTSIIEARLTHAHRLLSDDSRHVAEVAYAVGYTPAHFATAFRRRFGYPPSSMRRAPHG